MASADANLVLGHSPNQNPPQSAAETPQSLKKWWTTFKKKNTKDSNPVPIVEAPSGIFGVPLSESIKYANVAISLTNENGESFIYGYVPIVVAKCGVFLKEKATDVEGIFRLSGSSKRIKELQAIFDSPDRYGKGLDWTGYTVHDAANIFRRYLNQLPQPIVPIHLYERFRDPLRLHHHQAVGDIEAAAQGAANFDVDKAIVTYQQLITELPQLNRQLLLYILDLLAVFASKSDINLMTSANLAAIFQPGLLSHRDHDMKPQEYRLSQDVLIFLIDNQDSFLIGMNGTAADEKTVREVQSGPQSRQPSTPNSTRASQIGLGRSASNTSAGADSLRKLGIRRNASTSSKQSTGLPSPVTPSGAVAMSNTAGNGIYRSNTLPSRKSPALSSHRFRAMESAGTSPITSSSTEFAHLPNDANKSGRKGTESQATEVVGSKGRTHEGESKEARAMDSKSTATKVYEHASPASATPGPLSSERMPTVGSSLQQSPGKTEDFSTLPSPSQKTGLLAKSPSDSERREPRQPKKLQKRRLPSSAQPSANSSSASLTQPEPSGNSLFFMPMASPGLGSQPSTQAYFPLAPEFANTAATPTIENAPDMADAQNMGLKPGDSAHDHKRVIQQGKSSPANSIQSKSSVTDHSEADHHASSEGKTEKKSKWRFSSSTKKNGHGTGLIPIVPTSLGSRIIPEASSSSTGSLYKAHHSTIDEVKHPSSEPSGSSNALGPASATESSKELPTDGSEKRGPLTWLKAKVAHAKEERKERDIEKERAKSPPRYETENSNEDSLLVLASDAPAVRGRSKDAGRTEARPFDGSESLQSP